MSNDSVENSQPAPHEARNISRRSFLKGLIVGGAAAIAAREGVDVFSGDSEEEVRAEEAHEVSAIINQYVNRNENTDFWNKFTEDLKKGSSNIETHHNSNGNGLTKNVHAYDYWRDGDKNGVQDVMLLVIDPDAQSYSSRSTLINLTMGDDGGLGDAPDSVEDRNMPVENVQDAMSRFFKLPQEAEQAMWRQDHSRFAIRGGPLTSTIKSFEDVQGAKYRLEADNKGNMTFTTWDPQPVQNRP